MDIWVSKTWCYDRWCNVQWLKSFVFVKWFFLPWFYLKYSNFQKTCLETTNFAHNQLIFCKCAISLKHTQILVCSFTMTQWELSGLIELLIRLNFETRKELNPITFCNIHLVHNGLWQGNYEVSCAWQLWFLQMEGWLSELYVILSRSSMSLIDLGFGLEWFQG